MMFVRQVFAAALVVLALGGCQTSQGDQYTWIRTDGRRSTGDPALEREFVIAKTICEGRQAESASNMDPVYYQGLAGAVGASIVQSQRADMLTTVADGCMAEQGYIRVPNAEAESTATSLRAAQAASR